MYILSSDKSKGQYEIECDDIYFFVAVDWFGCHSSSIDYSSSILAFAKETSDILNFDYFDLVFRATHHHFVA